MSNETRGTSEVEAVVTDLLAATESLHTLLQNEADPDGELDVDALASAFDDRERAFLALERLHEESTWAPNAAMRSCLDRIGELDHEILTLGASSLTTAAGARHAAQRKRALMHAQHARGRDEPRLITVKA